MRIGLISDTQIPSMGVEPPPQVARAFEGVDLILHAGDVYTPSCLEWLERIAPVTTAETGWLDSSSAAQYYLVRFSERKVVEVEGHSIGLVHELILSRLSGADDVFPGAIERKFPPEESLPAALQDIFGRPVDIVVFGYTQRAMVELHQGVLLVNPGSPSLVKGVRRLGTVAILELTPESREARIIDLAGLDQWAVFGRCILRNRNQWKAHRRLSQRTSLSYLHHCGEIASSGSRISNV